jgi:two-component system, cell cycle sensor histidine kinase and response regulator CckA
MNVETITARAASDGDRGSIGVRDGGGPLDAIHALRESEERFRAVFQNAGIGMALGNLAGETVATNAALQRMLGYTADELMRMPLPLADPEDAAEDLRLMQQVITREKDHYQLEKRYIRRDGGILWGRLTVSVIFSPEGAPCYAVGMVEDITEQKHAADELARSQEQLRQSQKMEAIGRLAGGVAHDFNNILTAILGHAHVLLDSLPEGEDRGDVDEIRLAAERAAGLTRQLLAFSRRQVLQPRTVDLNEVIRSIHPMLLRLIGEDLSLEAKLSPGPCWVQADATQMEQVLVNLVVNGRDSMRTGGRIVITTGFIDRARESADEHAGTPSRHVALSVRDSGCGIPASILPNIFEPFFTTKPVGQGTGLGLPTVYGIVRQSDGFIEVDSTPGKGTTMWVYLPAAAEPQVETARAKEAGQRGGETVLLAEDEDAVRALAARVLRGRGFNVLEANGGTSALQVLADYRDPIHLLLADVIMPDLPGPILAGIVREQRPGIRTLFVSGYTHDVMTQRGELESHDELLEKPFTPEQLVRRVRAILDAA